MFKKQQEKRSHNILFVILRLLLSIVMFVILLAGMYAAYKHFSGLDPLKLDPQVLFKNVVAARTPDQLMKVLSSLKIDPKILGKSIPKTIIANPLNPETITTSTEETPKSDFTPAFRFLLISDPHTDNGNLEKAITQAKQTYPDLKFIIGLGDYSEVGTIEELRSAKAVFDSAGLRYFLVPGDHDLWDCRNRSIAPANCFKEVFGLDYQTFIFDDFKFLLLNNSDNYTGVGSEQLSFLGNQLEKNKEEGIKIVFVFMHEPLYHPSSDHVMGWVEKSLKPQAEMMLFKLKEGGATKIFSGDIHYFSKYSEPKTSLEMFTIGAISSTRNPQVPRFAVVAVGANGSIQVEDIEIK